MDADVQVDFTVTSLCNQAFNLSKDSKPKTVSYIQICAEGSITVKALNGEVGDCTPFTMSAKNPNNVKIVIVGTGICAVREDDMPETSTQSTSTTGTNTAGPTNPLFIVSVLNLS